MKGKRCPDCDSTIGKRVFCRPAVAGEPGIWANICVDCHIATECITPGYCSKMYSKMSEQDRKRLTRQREMSPKIAAQTSGAVSEYQEALRVVRIGVPRGLESALGTGRRSW